jgi:hypothetical protein
MTKKCDIGRNVYKWKEGGEENNTWDNYKIPIT